MKNSINISRTLSTLCTSLRRTQAGLAMFNTKLDNM